MADTRTQVKFTIEADIVSEFKSRCAAEKVSMASVVREWMIAQKPASEFKTKSEIKHQTRPQRRKEVQEIINILHCIMESESEYRDNIPENFVQRYEAADSACSLLEEAISCLEQAY
jgi:hypothetical protein